MRLRFRKAACRLITGALPLTLLFASPCFAQLDNSFKVTVREKTSAHPRADQGWQEAFALDGQQGASVALVRGQTYTFLMDNVPAIHPFYISTSDVGLSADPYNEGVTGNFATGDGEVTIDVTDSTPDLLYYQCGTHDYMGWTLHVVDEVSAGLDPVATGLTSPIAIAQPDDGTDRLFIVDQAGLIRVYSEGMLLEEPFLDVRSRMVTLNNNFDERGLLGLAFHPEYASNGRFVVYYSGPPREGIPEGWNHTGVVSEFMVAADDPNLADPSTERVLLQIDEPQFNHNGGTVLFGPDGYLYLSLGDGGGANDNQDGHVEDWYDFNAGGNGQDIEQNLLGNVLRIDVDSGDPYGIPPGNPFVEGDGLDEIYAYGLRNPYRMSFDQGGEFGLLVADAGQARWEEVSRVQLGDNLGWNVKEGTHCFDAANPNQEPDSCPDVVGDGHPDAGAVLVSPVVEYANGNQEDGIGLAVVGGAVYRGSALTDLQGKYVFGDWSTDFSSPDGHIYVAMPTEEGLWPFQPLELVNRTNGDLGHFLLAIGQDLNGELYVLTTNSAGPGGESGIVYRLIDPTNVAADPGMEVPDRVALEQNFPNPFNPSTTIEFVLASRSPVTLTVYDVLGRRVAVLLDGSLPAGMHSVTWDGKSDRGISAPSGAYVYRLETPEVSVSRLMTLLK